MKRCAVILLMLWCVSVSAQKPIRIFSTYAENSAAEQLGIFLAKGGCKTVFGGRNTGRTIYVGLAPEMRSKYKSTIDSLSGDGFFIHGDGRNVVIFGKGTKGTLYGVYAFLEMLGYRLYTPTALVVPDVSDFKFPKCHLVSNPAFAYREVSYFYPNHSQLYADWHHLHTVADRDSLFGMFVHTFKDLIPPARYFDAHPEWFSLNNGRRSRDGQLCLSNPAVLEELCRRLADTMATAPEKRMWSVSNNDNYNACQCPECLRMDSLYGGPTGTLLHFVNQVAHRFPDKTISTLAYQYTRCAPTNPVVKPEKNVNIMFCSIECGRELPIADNPREASFRKDMEDWSRLTDNIFMWDYVVQFRNFWNPFPNLHILQPNLQFFHKNGVRMMFEQATGSDNVTSWMDIRCYMLAKLLWDVDANIDSIMQDFLYGYYGVSGQYVKEIIDTMTSALIQSGQRLDIYGYPVDAADGYLSPERRELYRQLMYDAWQAPHDSASEARLSYFYASLCFAELELRIHEDTVGNEVLLSWLSSLTEILHEFQVPQMMEMGISPEEYRNTIFNYIDKRDPVNKAQHKSVALRHPARAPYNVAGLTDGKAGILDYRHRWIGFWGDTLDAVIDLGEATEVNSVSMDFYFYPLSWIFLPQRIEFLGSVDGTHWQSLEVFTPENPEILATPSIRTITANAKGSFRYMRVVAEPLPEIPAWHRAAGQKPWIFTDEIIVK